MRSRAILLFVLFGAALAGCRAMPPEEQGSNSSPSPGPSVPASEAPLDDDAQKLVALATEHLASRLNARVEEISAIRVRPVEWRDGSLGCPKPAVDYIQRKTPGYRIWLDARGDVYEYHTDDENRVVLCGQQ